MSTDAITPVSELEGIVPILPTPLGEGGALDEDGLRAVVRYAVEHGADGVVVLGSNGEFPYLSRDEKRRVSELAVEAAGGRVPVIGTASATATVHAVELARDAREAGCDAVMATVHAYWRMEPGAARDHVAAIAAEAPVFFYYFPEVTGLVLDLDEIAAIAALEGVVGAKVTVANAPFLRALVERTRVHGWRVFTGTTFLLDVCLEAGGAGAFCPLPLVAPDLVMAYRRALVAGDRGTARKLRQRVLRGLPLFSGLDLPPAVQALGFTLRSAAPYRGPGRRPGPTHGLLKEALRQRGLPVGPAVRAPHRPVDEAGRERVRRTLAALDRD